jgi:hypothetical protein
MDGIGMSSFNEQVIAEFRANAGVVGGLDPTG